MNPCTRQSLPSGILKEAKRRRINTAMEDLRLLPLGGAESRLRASGHPAQRHQNHGRGEAPQYTGVSNEIILENLSRVRETFPHLPVQIRTPVVPGFNDSEARGAVDPQASRDMPNVSYEALPYHRMGSPKYEYIGRNYLLAESKLDEGVMPRINRLIQSEFSHLRPENNAAQRDPF